MLAPPGGLGSCAGVEMLENRGIARKSKRQKRSFISSSSPPRAGVEGCPRCTCDKARALGSRLRRSPGLADSPIRSRLQRGLPIQRELRFATQTVTRAETFRLTVARRRRLLTVFPCTESQVSVDG